MLAHKRASHLHAWLVMQWTAKIMTISNVCFYSVCFEGKAPRKRAHFSVCMQEARRLNYSEYVPTLHNFLEYF